MNFTANKWEITYSFSLSRIWLASLHHNCRISEHQSIHYLHMKRYKYDVCKVFFCCNNKSHTQIHTHIHKRPCTHTHTHKHVHAHTCAYVCTYTQTHIKHNRTNRYWSELPENLSTKNTALNINTQKNNLKHTHTHFCSSFQMCFLWASYNYFLCFIFLLKTKTPISNFCSFSFLSFTIITF